MRYSIYHKTNCSCKLEHNQKLNEIDKDDLLASCQNELDSDGLEYSHSNTELLNHLLQKLNLIALDREHFKITVEEAFKDLDHSTLPESHKGRLADLQYLCENVVINCDNGSNYTECDLHDDIEYPENTGLRSCAVPLEVNKGEALSGFRTTYLRGQVYDEEAMANVMHQSSKDLDMIVGEKEAVA